MNKSPKILNVSWGNMEAEGFPPGKDFIIYPGGAEPWDWNLTNTSHESGIQPGNIKFLLGKGVEVVVMAQGMNGRLGVSEAAIKALEAADIEYYLLKTEAAVDEYNRLVEEGKQVGGLFHSTC